MHHRLPAARPGRARSHGHASSFTALQPPAWIAQSSSSPTPTASSASTPPAWPRPLEGPRLLDALSEQDYYLDQKVVVGAQAFLARHAMRASSTMDLWTAFLLGLVGSLHCAGMCGPLALALPAAGNTTPAYVAGPRRLQPRDASSPTASWASCSAWSGATLAAGRASSAGFPSRWASHCCSASSPRASWPCGAPGHVGSWTSSSPACRCCCAAAPSRRLAVLGLLNGLLPCGLVYVACAGAAATGGILAGAHLHGRVRRRHRADDAGHQPLRQTGPALAAPAICGRPFPSASSCWPRC